MLTVFTILIVLITGWAQYRNGLFTSIAMLVMVFISGLVAFNFFEPLAGYLEVVLQPTPLAGCEDMIVLIVLFSVTFLGLRVASIYLNPDMIDEHGTLQHIGAGAVGMLTGYVVAGFLICATETLPIDEHFLGFEPRRTGEIGYRRLLPPDRVWLSFMRHAGARSLAWQKDNRTDANPTFDQDATFELRYQRYRRGSVQYMGEFETELGRGEKKK